MPLFGSGAPAGLLKRARAAADVLIREAAKFGVIGLIAFIIDTTIYNVLVFGAPGSDASGVMEDIPVRAKILATSVAMTFAWLGNRYWTFRHRRRAAVAHEFALFIVFNIIGLGIAAGCLFFSRYVLDLHSQLADNISANGVGLVLGTLFRFWAYRTYVFKGDALADIDVPLLHHDEEADGGGDDSEQDSNGPSDRDQADAAPDGVPQDPVPVPGRAQGTGAVET